MYWFVNWIDSLVNRCPLFVIAAEHILNPSVKRHELIAYVPYKAFCKILNANYYKS